MNNTLETPFNRWNSRGHYRQLPPVGPNNRLRLQNIRNNGNRTFQNLNSIRENEHLWTKPIIRAHVNTLIGNPGRFRTLHHHIALNARKYNTKIGSETFRPTRDIYVAYRLDCIIQPALSFRARGGLSWQQAEQAFAQQNGMFEHPVGWIPLAQTSRDHDIQSRMRIGNRDQNDRGLKYPLLDGVLRNTWRQERYGRAYQVISGNRNNPRYSLQPHSGMSGQAAEIKLGFETITWAAGGRYALDPVLPLQAGPLIKIPTSHRQFAHLLKQNGSYYLIEPPVNHGGLPNQQYNVYRLRSNHVYPYEFVRTDVDYA